MVKVRPARTLSTTAVLDRYDIKGAERHNLESEHRAEKVAVGPPGDQVVLRDQKPMAPERFRKALPDHVTPSQWYRHLNGMVFLWAQEARLHRLLDAQHYQGCEHDVLTVDTASLVKAYEPKILLCHMNSGNTFPKPSKRDFGAFKSIADFPGPTKKAVVEVVVEYAIPDIASFVIGGRHSGSPVRRQTGWPVVRS